MRLHGITASRATSLHYGALPNSTPGLWMFAYRSQINFPESGAGFGRDSGTESVEPSCNSPRATIDKLLSGRAFGA